MTGLFQWKPSGFYFVVWGFIGLGACVVDWVVALFSAGVHGGHKMGGCPEPEPVLGSIGSQC